MSNISDRRAEPREFSGMCLSLSAYDQTFFIPPCTNCVDRMCALEHRWLPRAHRGCAVLTSSSTSSFAKMRQWRAYARDTPLLLEANKTLLQYAAYRSCMHAHYFDPFPGWNFEPCYSLISWRSASFFLTGFPHPRCQCLRRARRAFSPRQDPPKKE